MLTKYFQSHAALVLPSTPTPPSWWPEEAGPARSCVQTGRTAEDVAGGGEGGEGGGPSGCVSGTAAILPAAEP